MNDSNRYKGKNGQEYHRLKHGCSNLVYGWIAKNRKHKFQRLIRSSDRVLEFGVGNGWNLYFLKAKEKIGYDIIKNEEYFADVNIKFVKNLKNYDNYFDVVICNHVLEHVKNPAHELETMRQKLRRNGKLILSLPAEKTFDHFTEEDTNQHLFCWNKKTIGNLLTLTGFRSLKFMVFRFGFERRAGMISEKISRSYKFYRIVLAIMQFFKPVREIVIIARR